MTSVPLNETRIDDVCAKPTPVIFTIVPGTPDDLSSVIDGESTVNVADSLVGDMALSVTVTVALPGTVVGVVIMMLNVPAAEDFG